MRRGTTRGGGRCGRRTRRPAKSAPSWGTTGWRVGLRGGAKWSGWRGGTGGCRPWFVPVSKRRVGRCQKARTGAAVKRAGGRADAVMVRTPEMAPTRDDLGAERPERREWRWHRREYDARQLIRTFGARVDIGAFRTVVLKDLVECQFETGIRTWRAGGLRAARCRTARSSCGCADRVRGRGGSHRELPRRGGLGALSRPGDPVEGAGGLCVVHLVGARGIRGASRSGCSCRGCGACRRHVEFDDERGDRCGSVRGCGAAW